MKDEECVSIEHIKEESRLSESRYRQIFDNNPLPCLLYDPETLKIVDINNAAVRHYQYTREEFLNMTIQEIRAPEDIPSLSQYSAKTKPSLNGKTRCHKRKNGSVISVEVTECSLDFTGKTCVIAIMKDITEQKKAEEEKNKLQAQLFQTKKLEAISQLAGAIAHDFNNVLTSLTGYGSLLQMELPENSPPRLYADYILASAEKAAHLTQSLLVFSRQQVMTFKPCDLNDIIMGVQKLLKRLLTEDIELKVNLTEEKLVVMADIAQIDQVIINLLTNAMDAMPNGGILAIETKFLSIDPEHPDSDVSILPGKYAFLSISDSGIGMNDAIKEKIFDPFFTTKEVGQGTGLGLSTVYGIVKQHNGFIKVYSEEHHGTTFKIYLPILDNTQQKQQPALFETKKGTETILLAEDDGNVRRLAKEVLERTGYAIIEAVNGEDALQQFLRNKDKIDFLIIDMIMPKKNGKEVYNEIKKINPRLKALFMSGYAKDIIVDKGIYGESDNFLSKPLSPNELLLRVREMLDQQ